MNKVLDTPREDYKPFVPRIVQIQIAREQIGAIIGPGGKIIQEMQRETGTIINIEEKGDLGIVDIAASDKQSIDAAIARIKGILAVPEVGEVYEGKVKTIQPYGAFVEILPNKDGLLHISEYSWERIDSLEGLLKEGDMVQVKLLAIEPKTGKLKLSRKVLLPRPPRKEKEEVAKPE